MQAYGEAPSLSSVRAIHPGCLEGSGPLEHHAQETPLPSTEMPSFSSGHFRHPSPEPLKTVGLEFRSPAFVIESLLCLRPPCLSFFSLGCVYL